MATPRVWYNSSSSVLKGQINLSISIVHCNLVLSCPFRTKWFYRYISPNALRWAEFKCPFRTLRYYHFALQTLNHYPLISLLARISIRAFSLTVVIGRDEYPRQLRVDALPLGSRGFVTRMSHSETLFFITFCFAAHRLQIGASRQKE